MYRHLAILSMFATVNAILDPVQHAFQAPDNSFIWEKPPLNSTDNLVFNTVSSLLQHWPNTRYRNGVFSASSLHDFSQGLLQGHTVVPGQVPVGTLLYHGTFKNEIPEVPDWIATDPEHSFAFCRSVSKDSGCWHLTLITTRPLKILYFDGSSAAKMAEGVMDSQDLLIWGKVMPEKTIEEGERIGRLCEWGKQYELDGFLRMTINFEIMLCDFSAGVKVVSFLNIASADNARHTPLQLYPETPKNPKVFPLRLSTSYRVLESGSWHNHFPGETRIHLDYSRLISFYDTSLFPRLHLSRTGVDRLSHRLDDITPEETNIFKTRLQEVLSQGLTNPESRIDWKALLDVITSRYAERLELLHYILSSTAYEPDYNATLKQAHRQVSSMIAPYMLWSSMPSKEGKPALADDYSHWAAPVFYHCSTTHIRDIEAGELFKLTDSERLIVEAIQGVSREICRVVVGIWAEGMMAGLDGPDTELPPAQVAAESAQDLTIQWKSRVENLMSWLDWNYWIRCRPMCGYEEMCYIPMWPFFLTEEERTNPQPKCIRRLESFEFKT